MWLVFVWLRCKLHYINFIHLFAARASWVFGDVQDDEGKTGPFIDELRHQVTMERLKYVDDIKAALVAETGYCI